MPDPGSEFFHPDQGSKDPESGSAAKNLSQTMVSQVNMIGDVHPDPEVKKAPDPGSTTLYYCTLFNVNGSKDNVLASVMTRNSRFEKKRPSQLGGSSEELQEIRILIRTDRSIQI
jgi:hypothetical protein